MKNKDNTFTPTPVCIVAERTKAKDEPYYRQILNSLTLHKLVRGFTLVELLVVIAVIAMLLAVLVPTLHRAREQAKRILCGNQMKQAGLGLAVYANANDSKLPSDSKAAAYIYLWDLATPAINAIAKSAGAEDKPDTLKNLFYCPSAPREILTEALKKNYWEPRVWGTYNYRVVGYFYLLKRPPGGGIVHIEAGKAELLDRLNTSKASVSELITDMVLSQRDRSREGGLMYTYVEEVAGQPMPTNHIRKNAPLGGNVVYADLHMRWRNFGEMKTRGFGAGTIKLWF
jgi:prepilin-type N-terminal cleavage/methylation domain-containing protein